MPVTQRLRRSAAARGQQTKQDLPVENSRHDENGYTTTGWQNAVILAFAASALARLLVLANSKAAAKYHVGFPAIARSVYGMWGRSYQVAIRCILACVWYAGEGVRVCQLPGDYEMMTIFGQHFPDIPNQVPGSIGYTTQKFLCYFISWVIMIPFLFKRPYQMKWFFTSSCILSFPAIFGLFIYCLIQSGGEISLKEFGCSLLSTSAKAWQIIYAFSSTISNGATYIKFIPCIARWANSQRSPIWITIFTNSVFNPPLFRPRNPQHIRSPHCHRPNNLDPLEHNGLHAHLTLTHNRRSPLRHLPPRLHLVLPLTQPKHLLKYDPVQLRHLHALAAPHHHDARLYLRPSPRMVTCPWKIYASA
ncbi:permease for cytosine/purines, uracil, thiamine, allantoin-domain-containing protein [Aspergillus spectabilis]